MAGHKYLVVGARGLVGRAVLRALDAEGAEVIGLARGRPDFPVAEATSARWLQLDLTDRLSCAAALSKLEDVSHIVYCALQEQPQLISGWRDAEQIRTNTDMLTNLLDAIEPSRHFTLLQGTKAYGAHIAPMRLPGKESDPRHPGENFYWHQEDLLRARQNGKPWTFNILRPQIVCGVALGSPMNMVSAIGVYAAIEKALGHRLSFPGGSGFVTEATDADLLARSILWAGRTPAAANETFNVTNGDVLDWESLWPDIAAVFDMPVGEPELRSLVELMPRLSGAWDDLVQVQRLAPYSMTDIIGSSWQFADAVFGTGGGATTLLSTIKIRQFGFAECIDTAEMFRAQLRELQTLNVLPR